MSRSRAPTLRVAALLALLGSAACAQILGADFGAYATACTDAAACDDQNPCTADACGAEGRCTHEPTSDGDAPPALQRSGDCLKVYCLGGALTAVDDDADVADDGSTCTADACERGRAVHAARPDDSSCEVGAATGRCAGGACVVECGEGLPPCDDGSRCTEDACDGAGRCVFDPLPDQPIPGATDAPGDCEAPRCVGGVEVLGAPAPTDVPTGPSPACAVGSCGEDGPLLTPRPAGFPCEGGGRCDGAGACVECVTADDCVGLPPSGDCQVRACEAHACAMKPAPANTPTAAQIAGDCQVVVCDGQGNAVSKTDDADVPVDGNDCRDHLCVGGVPTKPPLAPDTKCGEGLAFVCDGAGHCVGCTSAAQCAGVDDACKTRTCSANTCGFDYAPNGLPLPEGQQTPGDCRTLACNGAGGTKLVAANGDVQDDGNPCTADGCLAGNPVHQNLPADTACNNGGYCDGSGTCGQCNKASQCPVAPTCKAAACTAHQCTTTNVGYGGAVSQQTPGDCKVVVCDGNGGTTTKPDTNDLPNDANQCTSDTCSAQGTPTFTPRAAHYACNQNGGKVCDGSGKCVACVDNSECTAPQTCGGGNPGTPNVCGCTKKTCAQAGATCGAPADGCGGALGCDDGVKNGSETDVDCGGSGSCTTKCAAGKACVADADCQSNACVGNACQ